MPRSLIRLTAAISLVLLCSAARAQIVDDVDWHRDGKDAVLRISFTVPIQFRRTVVASANNLAQVFYDIRPTNVLPQFVPGERGLPASEGLPAITIIDESVFGVVGRKLVIRFDPPVSFRVGAGPGNNRIDVVIPGAGAAVDARGPVPPPRSANDRFMITLQSSTDPSVQMDAPVPGALQNYQMFTSRRVINGKRTYEINLGYFETREEADRAQRILAPRFRQAVVVELAPQVPQQAAAAVGGASLPVLAAPSSAPAPPALVSPPAAVPGPVPTVVLVAALQPAAAPPPPDTAAPPPRPPVSPVAADQPSAPVPPAPETAATPVPLAEVEARGRALAAQGRAAMEKNDFDQAVTIYNQLLNLPPNSASQEAQEMIGIARARQGDTARARAEFDLYLKLYPMGDGAERVRRELAQLPAATAVASAKGEPATPRPAITTVTGSASQYYYGGSSLITTLTEGTPIGGVPQPPESTKISNVDQSQLASSIDMNYRRRDADSDIRFVVRDIYVYNFLDTPTVNQRPPNRLYALYGEYRSLLPSGFWGRAGRQPATTAGVPGRFDGVRVGYRFNPNFGISVVGGVPSDDLYETNQNFYGLSLDVDNIADRFGASLYGIHSTVDGEIDRQAIGTELRYFDPTTSVYSVFDYDTFYHAMNIESVQGTFQTLGNSLTFSLLADKRTAPMLATSNVLFAVPPPLSRTEPFRTLTDVLSVLSLDEVHRLVKATTTYIKQGLFGVNWQMSPQVQLGVDARYFNVGPLPAYKDIPAQPGSGNVYSYGLQGIFSNLYSERDAHVFSFAYLDGPTYKGKVAGYNNLSLVWGGLQFEPWLRYYRQDDVGGAKISRWSPGMRLSWQLGPHWSIESNFSAELTDSTSAPLADGSTLSDTSHSYFYYVGYRYDF